jgi:hypothetical protein
MERTFQYSFTPTSQDPVGGPTVQLAVTDIEDAALREILQTPGAGLGTWSLLGDLLTATGPNSPFTFREPLGQAREVKVALSGLFGRFVARAYLERYFGLSVFAHLSNSGLMIDARRQIAVTRTASGDLPDWVACTRAWTRLTVAEAKGCHDPGGPQKALMRAWTQAQRVDVTCRSLPISIKRIAISTRWGSARGGASVPVMSVRDPDETGAPMTPDDERALFVGLLRRHLATLLGPLGHTALRDALLRLATSRQPEKVLVASALGALDKTAVSVADHQATALEEMVGGLVTRQGVVADRRLPPEDEVTLVRLQLRPQFVGVERPVIRAAILGTVSATQASNEPRPRRGRARGDGSGVWVVPLFAGEEG